METRPEHRDRWNIWNEKFLNQLEMKIQHGLFQREAKHSPGQTDMFNAHVQETSLGFSGAKQPWLIKTALQSIWESACKGNNLFELILFSQGLLRGRDFLSLSLLNFGELARPPGSIGSGKFPMWWANPSLTQYPEHSELPFFCLSLWSDGRPPLSTSLTIVRKPEVSESPRVQTHRKEWRRKRTFLLATPWSISGVEQKPLKHSHDSVPSPQITNDRHAGSKGGTSGKYPLVSC